jgi:hypothetical protein
MHRLARDRFLLLLLPAIAVVVSACGTASEGSTLPTTSVVVKAVPTPDVRVHYTVSLTCGSTDTLTAMGITARDDASTACAFLRSHPALFTTRHMCVTVDGGSAAVTETTQGKTSRSCIGGRTGGGEGVLLRQFQTLLFGRS